MFGLILNDGLVAYYPFNGNARDASGNGNHGNPIGNINYLQARYGDGVRLDGSRGCIIVKDFPHLYSFTISIYFQIFSLNRESNNLLAFENPNDELILFFRGDNTLRLETHNDEGKPITVLPTGNFVHLVFINDISNNQKQFFIDSMLVKTIDHADNYNTGNLLQIGCENSISQTAGDAGVFNGILDDIRIYNRALSES